MISGRVEMLHFRPRGGGGTVNPETQKRKLDSQEMKDWAYLGSWRPAWVALDSVVSNKERPQRKLPSFLALPGLCKEFWKWRFKSKRDAVLAHIPFHLSLRGETETGFFLSQLAAPPEACYSYAGG